MILEEGPPRDSPYEETAYGRVHVKFGARLKEQLDTAWGNSAEE
jgi:hypothetical protein